MNYIFNNNLKVGDVILTNSIAINDILKSKIQKFFTKGNYTHTILYIGQNRFIEADSGGVSIFPITDISFHKKENIKIIRYKNYTELVHLEDKIYNLSTQKYNYMNYNFEGIRAFIKLAKPHNKKVFCSELVTKIYEDINIKLFNIESHKITPAHYESSNSFFDITNICLDEVYNLPTTISKIYDMNKMTNKIAY